MDWKSQIDQALPIVAKALVEKTGLPVGNEWNVLAQAAENYGRLMEEAKPATYCKVHKSIGSEVWQECHYARLMRDRGQSVLKCDLQSVSIVGHLG